MKFIQYLFFIYVVTLPLSKAYSQYDTDTLQANHYFDSAEQLMDSSLHKQAIILYQKAATIYEKRGLWKQYAIACKKTGQNYYYLSKHDQAIECYERALSTVQNRLEREELLLAEIYNDAGVSYGKQGYFDQQLDYYHKALAIRTRILGENHLSVAKLYYNLAVAYGRIGHYEQQLHFHEKALRIRIAGLGEYSAHVAESYNALGDSYGNLNNLDKQIQYYKKALDIRIKVLGENSNRIGENYNNIGIYYGKMEQFDKELLFYQKALALFLKNSVSNSLEISKVYNNMGGCYGRKNDYDKQLEYYKKALQIRINTLGESHQQVANIYNNMGICYGKKGDLKNQFICYQKAVSIIENKFGSNHPKVANLYNHLAEHYIKKQNLAKALNMLQNASVALLYDFDHKHTTFKNINAKNTLLTTLTLKGNTLANLYRNQNYPIDTLRMALQTYSVAVQLIDTIRLGFSTDASKQGLMQVTFLMYEGAISVAHTLFDITQNRFFLEKAFQFAEKSKATRLRQALKNSEARDFANVPQLLVAREKELLSDIVFYQKELDKAKLRRLAQKISLYENKLFALHRAYEQLIKKLEQEYPKYHDLKYNTTVVSVNELQDYLPPETLLVEYFQGETSLFAFCITKDTMRLHRFDQKTKLSQQVKDFLQCLNGEKILNARSVAGKQGVFDEYAKQAYALYRSVLKPVFAGLKKEKIKNIIVVPDGSLHYIPFEALVTQKNRFEKYDFSELRYLLHDYQVAYAHSATILVTSEKHTSTVNQSAKMLFAGFAPMFYDLKNTQREVKHIIKVLKSGDSYIGREATKQVFLEKAKHYKILHLATHAYTDDTNPLYSGFVFNANDSSDNGILNAIDLYNLEINASLVVLSACKTRYGQLMKGEGMMSLSRAFAYANCPSVVSSLWEAPDDKTVRIMEIFYHQLQQEKTIDDALREAKLDYLQNIGHAYYSHPYFWAGFVPVGNMEALEMHHERSRSLWLLGGLIIGVISISFWYYTKKSKSFS